MLHVDWHLSLCVTQESDEPSERETKEEKSPSDSSSDGYDKDVVSCPFYLSNK